MKYTLTLVIASMMMLFIYSENKSTESRELLLPKEVSSKSIDTLRFTPEGLKQALYLLGVKNPDIVYKQAVLETKHFTSNIFKENNNLFGMKHPNVRSTTSLGKNRGHAKYANWLDSVIDMTHFQNYYSHRIKKSSDYYKFLDGVYAIDGSYTKKLKSISI